MRDDPPHDRPTRRMRPVRRTLPPEARDLEQRVAAAVASNDPVPVLDLRLGAARADDASPGGA